MITIEGRGIYHLFKAHQKLFLSFDTQKTFLWKSQHIKDMLQLQKQQHTDDMLCMGNYRIYSVGLGSWQGYLLPLGLPTNAQKRKDICPTDELITFPIEVTTLPSV